MVATTTDVKLVSSPDRTGIVDSRDSVCVSEVYGNELLDKGSSVRSWDVVDERTDVNLVSSSSWKDVFD